MTEYPLDSAGAANKAQFRNTTTAGKKKRFSIDKSSAQP
jgi:hypothetical protein